MCGGGGTSVIMTTKQQAAQAANVTVNPSTTVSLAIDTQAIADALKALSFSNIEIADKGIASNEQLYKATLAIGLANLQLASQEADYKAAEIQAEAKEEETWQALSVRFYGLVKMALVGYGLYLFSRRN
uniref:Uncharacterized protein n=1 Tax=viral metagenome TaxID=1070528 RepID=A0A6M3JLY1_9ZZZZ